MPNIQQTNNDKSWATYKDFNKQNTFNKNVFNDINNITNWINNSNSSNPNISNNSYTHTQSNNQKIWDIHHNLGKEPHIDFYDENGILFIAYYARIDDNNSQAIINFPSRGRAECKI